jgi:hypothetical protein
LLARQPAACRQPSDFPQTRLRPAAERRLSNEVSAALPERCHQRKPRLSQSKLPALPELARRLSAQLRHPRWQRAGIPAPSPLERLKPAAVRFPARVPTQRSRRSEREQSGDSLRPDPDSLNSAPQSARPLLTERAEPGSVRRQAVAAELVPAKWLWQRPEPAVHRATTYSLPVRTRRRCSVQRVESRVR